MNLTLGKRLSLSFFGILLLTGIAGFFSYRGISAIRHGVSEIVSQNDVLQLFLAREIDHLNWAKKVSEFLINPKIEQLTVQTDDHKCKFGEWYYGPERKAAESEFPAISPALKEIEKYHNALHQSAVAIAR